MLERGIPVYYASSYPFKGLRWSNPTYAWASYWLKPSAHLP